MDRVRIATTVRPETRQRIYSLMERNPRTLTTVGEAIDYLVTLETHDARDAMRARLGDCGCTEIRAEFVRAGRDSIHQGQLGPISSVPIWHTAPAAPSTPT